MNVTPAVAAPVVIFLWFAFTSAFAGPLLAVHEDRVHLEPLWEIGLGGGATFTPDYPGSSQNHLWSIPFPFLVYRGEILHSDRRGGTRARIFQRASYEFNVSASGGLPSSSGGNTAREGMPNLELLGAFGPRLMVDLYSVPERSLLRVGIPIRFAYSWDWWRLRDRGFIIAPELLYDLPGIFDSRCDFFTLLTVSWADKRFQSYYYEVEPEFTRADRPAYEARAGYFMTDLSFGIVTNFFDRRVKLNTAVTVMDLHGTTNHASPLFRQSVNYSVGAVLIWVFGKSEEKVLTDD